MAFKEPYESLQARLLANSAPYDGGYTTECWFWLGNRNAKQYGRLSAWDKITHKFRKLLAHRVSYETFVGPIPPGFDVDHKCTNHWCIAPDHLQACEVQINRGWFVRHRHADGRRVEHDEACA